jgi:starch phosphorylase
MRPLGHYRAAPEIPEALEKLRTLAHDLRWAWRVGLRKLFEELDPAAWEASLGNPVLLLQLVDPERLAARASDAAYVEWLNLEADGLATEEREGPREPLAVDLASAGHRIAYFCAEFGLTEVLPIYSGGLGILAGDHLKSASDLGVPLVAVGLFYRGGFFRQALGANGWQTESYPIVDADDMPLSVLKPPSGLPPIVRVRVIDRDVAALVRVAKVGRVTLLLLDTHVPENRPSDRDITSRLYGGDLEKRIQQEIVLGVGGVRALELAGLPATVRHANEGHATFLGLEEIRRLRERLDLSFDEAREVAAAGNVFTTHTPVPAGIDLFPPDLMRRYFEQKVEEYGLSMDRFLGLGRQVPEEANEYFSMAVLGLKLSTHVNGVSRLHATVARRLWRGVFPEAPISEIPIGHVTNGVHAPTWTAPVIAELTPDGSHEPPDREELWRRHETLRASLVQGVRDRVAESRRRRGAPDSEIAAAQSLLDPKTLTITFARRFATYKRSTLIFHDTERLARILSDVDRPVQLVFAGKAHPKDEPGKEFLKRVGEHSQSERFRGKVVLLEGYDMRLSRLLVQGSDVWLNNPRRPYEASGTSGMKAAMNGVLHCSVLDGWWDEAQREGTGFVIGDDAEGRSDEEVATALYERLEQEIVPLFYERPYGDRNRPPEGWVDRMVAAATTLGQQFSSDRMLRDYLRLAYLPAATRTASLLADGARGARLLAAWKAKVRAAWGEIGFVSVNLSVPDPARLAPGTVFDVDVEVRLRALEPEDVAVEWFEGATDADGVVDAGRASPLSLVERLDGRAFYRGSVVRPEDDTLGYSVRIRPSHPELTHPNELGLVLWAG